MDRGPVVDRRHPAGSIAVCSRVKTSCRCSGHPADHRSAPLRLRPGPGTREGHPRHPVIYRPAPLRQQQLGDCDGEALRHPADDRPAPLQLRRGTGGGPAERVSSPTNGRLHCGLGQEATTWVAVPAHPVELRPAPLQHSAVRGPWRPPGRQPAGSFAAGLSATWHPAESAARDGTMLLPRRDRLEPVVTTLRAPRCSPALARRQTAVFDS